jgi:hypothetical protein
MQRVLLANDGIGAAHPDDASPSLTPGSVPVRLTKYHRVAREFRDRANLHEVSRKALPRVPRIVLWCESGVWVAGRQPYEVATKAIKALETERSAHPDPAIRRPGRRVRRATLLAGTAIVFRSAAATSLKRDSSNPDETVRG